LTPSAALSLYIIFQGRKALLLFLLAALLVPLFILASRVTTREDISDLIPQNSRTLSVSFDCLSNSPFMHILTITIGGTPEDREVYINEFIKNLKCELIPDVINGPGAILTSASLEKLMAFPPNLLSGERISRLRETLSDDYIHDAVIGNKMRLLSPVGPLTQNLIALDPLHLHRFFLQDIASLGRLGRFTIREGNFVDKSGDYSLVVARPSAAMSDSASSAANLDHVRKAVGRLPDNVEAYITGSYVHTKDNATVIKEDLQRILPISLSLLIFLVVLFLRNPFAVAVLSIPAFSLVFAVVAVSVIFGAVSGIVLAFGSVILGISVDYAIHTYYSLSTDDPVHNSLPHLAKLLQMCALTTLAAFACLCFSETPAIRHMSMLGIFGIIFAGCLSLVFLPHFIQQSKNIWFCSAQSSLKNFNMARLTFLCAALAAIITVCAVMLPVDGDIRNLSLSSEKLRHDEAKSNDIWGFSGDIRFIVSQGEDCEQGMQDALRMNESVWNLLTTEKIQASSIAPLLPSKETQAVARTAWTEFSRNDGRIVLEKLKAEQAEAGFSPLASEGFGSLLNRDSGLLEADTLREIGMGFFLDMFITRAGGRVLVYTMLPGGAEISDEMESRLQETGASLVSAETFRLQMADAIRNEIFRFCSVTLAVVVIVVFLLFRSVRRYLPVLLPMLTALTGILLFFRLSGIHVNIFHATAMPLVMGLSVDYGIFMQSAMERHISRRAVMSILLSSLTSLAGFGCLLLARHPVLLSIGAAATVGIAAAAASAIWLMPRLSCNREEDGL
jgi:predicted exporter